MIAAHSLGTRRSVLAVLVCIAAACVRGDGPTAPAAGGPQFDLVAATTFTVNSSNDVDDGACSAAHCSLREAIGAANAGADASAIAFAIAGAGPHTIALTSALPPITQPALLDGYTQPGATVNTAAVDQGTNATLKIVLDGSAAGASVDGVVVSATGSVVRGLVVHSFTRHGIRAVTPAGAGIPIKTDIVIEGNFVGTDASGSAALPNAVDGVVLDQVRTSLVGGSSNAARNLIAGNARSGISVQGGAASDNVIAGNLIGTTATGAAPLGNGSHGVAIGSAIQRARIGGSTTPERNVISGNGSHGISLLSVTEVNTDETRIVGNYIGTDATGGHAVPNGGAGIHIDGAFHTQIGGTAAGERNVISGNSIGINTYASTTIEGNYIGTDAQGLAAVGNVVAGVVAQNLVAGTIGGSSPGAGNLISGNVGDGILFRNTATVGTIQGNYIGVDATGAAALPNATGIHVDQGRPDILENVISGNQRDGIAIQSFGPSVIRGNTIGSDHSRTQPVPNGLNGIQISNSRNFAIEDNFIAHNAAAGIILVQPAPPSSQFAHSNPFHRNAIFGNGAVGIDLAPNNGVTLNDPLDADIGANLRQNFPTLTAASASGAIAGTLASAATTTYRVELFANAACDPSGYGEGERFLAALDVTTDAAGDGSFATTVGGGLSAGQLITATATDPAGNTSEFSACLAVASENAAPTADAGGPYSGVEGEPIALALGGSDANGDALTFTWDLGDGTTGSGTTPPASHTYGDNPPAPATAYAITLTVDDGRGASDTKTTTVTVANRAPTATFTAPSPVNEGDAFTLSLSAPQDVAADLTTLEYRFDCGLGFGAWGTALSRACPTDDDAVRAVAAEIRDQDGGQNTYTGSVSVLNAPPVLGSVTVPVDPVAVGTAVTAAAPFTDPGTADTHAGFVQWGAGAAFEAATPGVDQAAQLLTATSLLGAGVYSISLRVRDDDGGEATATAPGYVVVYDPTEGFVTGGGWFNSPAGAYATDPSVAGKATFGFIAKYSKGASVPSGHTEFQFAVSGLKFKSTSYQWLVVAGARARYKGEGVVNGLAGYGFLVTARDGAQPGGGGSDGFRIKIWSLETGTVIYDNAAGEGDDSNAVTELEGGSVVIHK